VEAWTVKGWLSSAPAIFRALISYRVYPSTGPTFVNGSDGGFCYFLLRGITEELRVER
jgi:hypothetical protein